MKKQSITTKINILIILSITVITLSISYVVNNQVEKAMLKTYENSLIGLSTSNYSYLDTLYKGNWTVEASTLLKGETRADTMNSILDEIARDTGIAATIFLRDIRVATNVKVDGERVVGTKASEEVAKHVLNGETYIGVAEVVGTPHLTVYKPIQDADGQVIGMWFVGQSIESIDTAVAKVNGIIYTVIAIVGFITIVLSLFFVRKIVQPLRHIRSQLHNIAQGEGDLTQELHVHTQDEIGDLAVSFNQMLATLREMMKEIARTTDEITTSCEDLYQSATQTTSFTNETTSSLHKVADGADVQRILAQESEKNINLLQSNIGQVASAIEQVSSSSAHSTKQAYYGNEVIHQVVKQMELIRWSVAESEKVIQQLGKQSEEIGTISDVITNIADQTNLLALNAAIEAARAGEHGKGFAVVADEVRHLAEQSKDSAHQITQLIAAVQAHTEKAVHMMTKGSSEVTSGIDIVSKTEGAFTNIATAIEEVSAQFTQIVRLTNSMEQSVKNVQKQTLEMTSIANEVAISTTKVADISSEELAAMEEITASAKTLETVAENLHSLIHKFKF